MGKTLKKPPKLDQWRFGNFGQGLKFCVILVPTLPPKFLCEINLSVSEMGIAFFVQINNLTEVRREKDTICKKI